MAAPSGGRFLFSEEGASITLGINDGIDPIFPAPVVGNVNIEVFTAAGVTTLPTLDSGFAGGIIDPGGTLVAPGFLTGTNLQLFGGGLVTDSVTGDAFQTAANIILGSGNQTIVGAPGDTIQGGLKFNMFGVLVFAEVINAVQQFAGGAIIGGVGPTTVYGGPGDSVLAGSGSTYIDGTAGKMAIGVGSGVVRIVGTASTNTISGATTGPDTISGGSGAVAIQGSRPGRRNRFRQSDRQRGAQRDGREYRGDPRRRRRLRLWRGRRHDQPRLGGAVCRRWRRQNDDHARFSWC